MFLFTAITVFAALVFWFAWVRTFEVAIMGVHEAAK